MTNTSFHTHTFRCKHATGDVIDYARKAFEAGSPRLGISDHVALPDDRWPEARMAFSELDNYERAIESAQQALPNLQILKGMECEYAPEYHNYFKDELLGERAYDYLIGAGHYTPLNDGTWINSFESLNTASALKAYSTYLAQTMESGLFAFIAHPDLFGCSNTRWSADLAACSRDILQAAEATKTPLEINGYGFRKPPIQSEEGLRPRYPWRPFWEIAANYDIQVICNADAHRPQDVLANIKDAEDLANAFKLEIIDHLPSRNPDKKKT
mgnify:CR=1 FL=1